MTPAPAPPPQTIVIFGASGDLARRKVLPALWRLARGGHLPERYAIVGYARTGWGTDAFRAEAHRAVREAAAASFDEGAWREFEGSLSYVSGPYDEPGGFARLVEHLGGVENERSTGGRRLFYCATPPSAFPIIARRIGEAGAQRGARIVVEKPFGRDLGSARDLETVLHEVFEESQVFRIDHYLGKESVQAILVFRFANSTFERLWHRDSIDHVQVTVAESLGVEGRGVFYEEAGAIRDMLQNHLLQVLAFLAMEPPRSLEPEAIRDEKVKLLRTIRPFDPAEVVRGQYTAGSAGEVPAPAYRAEPGVAPASDVETFVAARARIDNWRWAGVPFFLRTGKRLARRATEIAVVFREVPAYLFEGQGVAPPVPNHLLIRIQPEEGISFAFQTKEPGPGFVPRVVDMDFSSRSLEAEALGDYERLLLDAMEGDHTLFIRRDEVERAWELAAPLLDCPAAMETYPAGSFGPAAADTLIAPRRWHLRAEGGSL
ncbi:MAG: glucose-6-phosphate dehydrogenase [Acidobacteria bacterium]|nr:glucose-6-phosphate dehydrogenase [Acidobacteriota bacterium]